MDFDILCFKPLKIFIHLIKPPSWIKKREHYNEGEKINKMNVTKTWNQKLYTNFNKAKNKEIMIIIFMQINIKLHTKGF